MWWLLLLWLFGVDTPQEEDFGGELWDNFDEIDGPEW